MVLSSQSASFTQTCTAARMAAVCAGFAPSVAATQYAAQP